MRRMLHVLKWLGLSSSMLLLAATVFCWVRSLGHWEGWRFYRFEPRPDWTQPKLEGLGIGREWTAGAVHGRLWLGLWTLAPWPDYKPETEYRRGPISADRANKTFDSIFQPGERPWKGGTERAWRFAGAGFYHGRDAVYPRLRWPCEELLVLALPFWMLAVVFGLWPVGFVGVRLLRKKCHPPGHCPQCGYDLRATPDPSGPRLPRCPECGWHTHERHSHERETVAASNDAGTSR